MLEYPWIVSDNIRCLNALEKLRESEFLIAIDSHAHVYPATAPLRALVAGGVRLLRAAGPGGCATLFLCEPSGQNVFRQLCEQDVPTYEPGVNGAWSVKSTNETTSVSIVGPKNERIIVVRGQQVVTSERLEVLAIGHIGQIPAGKSLFATIESVRAAGCHVILPWGVGKWLGHRGQLIDQAIDRLAFPGFHLGDNGGRPSFWSVPQFSSAVERNIKILRGSDPLPIRHDERRIGTYASVFRGELDRSAPWHSIAKMLEDPASMPDTAGSPMKAWQFVRSQVFLRAKFNRPSIV